MKLKIYMKQLPLIIQKLKTLKNMKKFKLISLSLMMLVCGKSISQTVTPQKLPISQKQESSVVIDTSIAKLIAKDLVSGDVCKAEIKLVRSNLTLTKKEVIFKDSIINTLGKQKEKLNLIILKKDEMFAKQEEISNTYKKALSKQKTTTFLYKALSLLGVVSTIILIVK
jgi:hypothetical protein